jgi:glyoxylase-like metal-dependent hydrolase (beta-lactamase superfamily II)
VRTSILGILCVLLAPLGPAADVRPNRGFSLDQLADGVYAVVRHEPAGLATHANNVVIVNDEDVMVVDTSQSLALTREVLAAIRAITKKPVRYVINTHWHDDHVIGNQVYREAFPEVDIIGHARTLRDLPAEGAPNRERMVKGLPPLVAKLRDAAGSGRNLAGAPITDEERAAYASDVEWAERYVTEVPSAPVILPTITVSDRLTLRRGSRLIDIRSLGPGHSQADLIVHLPAEKIVIAGDLVIAPVPLAGPKSSIRGWAAALDRLRELHPAIIVPGHGPIMRDDGYLGQLSGLFTSLAQQVEASAANGASLEATRAAVQLDGWRKTFAGDSQLRAFLFDYYVTGPGVAAAYREATEKSSLH